MKTKKSQFTLVELLVVIAIIGILAAMLFPAIGAAMDMAKQMACRAKVKGIGNLHTIYTTDRKAPPRTTNGSDQAERFGLLIFYYPETNSDAFKCGASGYQPQSIQRTKIIAYDDVAQGTGDNAKYRYDQDLRELVDYSMINKNISVKLRGTHAVSADGFRGTQADGTEEGHNHRGYGSAVYSDGRADGIKSAKWYLETNGSMALTDKDTGIKLY